MNQGYHPFVITHPLSRRSLPYDTSTGDDAFYESRIKSRQTTMDSCCADWKRYPFVSDGGGRVVVHQSVEAFVSRGKGRLPLQPRPLHEI